MRDARDNNEMTEAARSRFMKAADYRERLLATSGRFAALLDQMLYSRSLPKPGLDRHGHLFQSQEKDRPHRFGPEARAPGREAECRQHGAALEVPHRHQE